MIPIIFSPRFSCVFSNWAYEIPKDNPGDCPDGLNVTEEEFLSEEYNAVMDEVKRRWGKLYKAWYADPVGHGMPGGESFDDFWERARRAFEAVSVGDSGRVLVCGHKAINRAMIARALNMATSEVWPIPQPQLGLSVIVRENGEWRAERLGDASHLPETLRSES